MRFRYGAQLPVRAGMSQKAVGSRSIMKRNIQAGEAGRMSGGDGLLLENMDEVEAIGETCGQAGMARYG